ncbi:hypothetical protein CI109_102235 [Kwoniella shandongensis]|uniref:Uncharacterized protein n=1 Tax=Kwoniella shandongensis TaxID=1734106 RepID=A0A5M6BYM6_9TREE|nr:uncharacterized protein CI109_003611 [Kwoniella shandongensis]KAA5527957.1 hypothetical protein CI109_003611 [Kwoniella shandongensis]
MSLLPQYQKNLPKSDSESVPLFSAEYEDNSDPSPAYPPRLGAEGTLGGVHNVTYTFVPRWPVVGEQQDALGVLGRTKEETIAQVQCGFSILSDYPSNRIEFLVPVPTVADEPATGITRKPEERWGRVMDEAWSTFGTNPPSRLRIQVVDGPGDLEGRQALERRKKQRQIMWTVIAVTCPFWGMASILFIAWLSGGLSD